jgi:hypothetical protein
MLPILLPKLNNEPTIRLSELPTKSHENLPSYRIILDGKKTPLILENAAMNERAWVKRTKTGLIYGEALFDFSGAYSGTRTLCFAKYHGKLFSKRDYETKFAKEDSVLFVPFLQPVFKETHEAFLFCSGKFYSLGQIFEITAWTSRGIEGYIYMQDNGVPYSGPDNFDIENAVYKQEFIIHNGKRTLLGRSLVKERS